MRLSVAKNIVKKAILRQLELAKDPTTDEHKFIIPYLQGMVGIGKTSVVKQAAAELSQETDQKIYVNMVDLTIYDPAELAGLLMPNKDKLEMDRHAPDWLLPKEFKEGDYDVMVYFFDEVPQATKIIMNVFGQVIQGRRIGSYFLPTASAIVAAGNRQEDRAGTNPIPSQIKDRLAFLDISLHSGDALAHMTASGIHEVFVAFLGFKPERLHTFQPDVDKFTTPRGIEKASDVYMNWGLSPLELREMLNGILGKSTTTEFFAFLEVYDVVPNIDDLIANPMGAEVPDRADVTYAVCASLAAKANGKNIGNIIKYLDRLDAGEFAAFVIKGAIQNIPDYKSNQAIRDWAISGGGKELLL